MSSNNGKLTLNLNPELDRFGNKYYIAKLTAPILIDCSEKNGGVCFMIFVSDEGNEELQISHITKPRNKSDNRNDPKDEQD
jgi:hypothetical protein